MSFLWPCVTVTLTSGGAVGKPGGGPQAPFSAMRALYTFRDDHPVIGKLRSTNNSCLCVSCASCYSLVPAPCSKVGECDETMSEHGLLHLCPQQSISQVGRSRYLPRSFRTTRLGCSSGSHVVCVCYIGSNGCLKLASALSGHQLASVIQMPSSHASMR